MALIELSHSGVVFASIDEPQATITLDTKDKEVDDYIDVTVDIPSPVGEVY